MTTTNQDRLHILFFILPPFKSFMSFRTCTCYLCMLYLEMQFFFLNLFLEVKRSNLRASIIGPIRRESIISLLIFFFPVFYEDVGNSRVSTHTRRGKWTRDSLLYMLAGSIVRHRKWRPSTFTIHKGEQADYLRAESHC